MNTNDNHQDPKPLVEGNDASSELKAQSESRRRLLKKAGLVAVPVVTTLASRPVLAWHCRTPSMWGSMAMNPNTSLMKNEFHLKALQDESWYISNWADNSTRAGLEKPWNKLFSTFPTNRSTVFLKIKKSDLSNYPGVIVHSGYTTSTGIEKLRVIKVDSYNLTDFCLDAGIVAGSFSGTVSQLFSDRYSFKSHIIIAQLNKKLLPNTVGQCITIDLGKVAGGNRTVNGVEWSEEMFVDYFETNWIAVADTSSSSQGKWFGGYTDRTVINGDGSVDLGQYSFKSSTKQDWNFFGYFNSSKDKL